MTASPYSDLIARLLEAGIMHLTNTVAKVASRTQAARGNDSNANKWPNSRISGS